MATRARTIDEYLAGLDADSRAALEKVRRAIRAAAPALASVLGVVVGFLLIFWRLLLSPFKKLVKMIRGNRSDRVSGDTSLSE